MIDFRSAYSVSGANETDIPAAGFPVVRPSRLRFAEHLRMRRSVFSTGRSDAGNSAEPTTTSSLRCSPPSGRASKDARSPASLQPLQHLRQRPEELVDLGLGDDQRRRQRDDVAGGADQQPLLVGLEEGGEGALGRRAGDRLELDRADQAAVPEVDDVRQALEAVERVLPVLGDLRAAVEQPLLLVDVEGGEAGGATTPDCPNRCSRGRTR